MFLKVPEGFQRKKISSCADTLLLPIVLFIILMLDGGGGVECFLVSFNHNIFMAVQKTCDKILKLNVESKKCLTTLESNECLRQVNC